MSRRQHPTRRAFLEGSFLAGVGVRWLKVSAAADKTDSAREAIPDATGERVAASTADKYRYYQSRFTSQPQATAWVQIDLGTEQQIDAIKLFPSNNYAFPGNGFPVKFRIESAAEPNFENPTLIASRVDGNFPDPENQVLQFPVVGKAARFIRVTATELRQKKRVPLPGEDPSIAKTYSFALSRVAVMSGNRDIAVGRPVSVDSELGSAGDAAQITREPRPEGELVITDYPSQVTPSASWRRVAYKVTTPQTKVRLNGGLFQTAMEKNCVYLLNSFSTDDLLRQFRKRAGKPIPDSARKPHPFWEEDLAGSNAGRFLMGAGNTLKWMDHPELRARLNAVVDGIEECRQSNEYILAFAEDTVFVSERGAYTRSWTTHGLIDAGYAGNTKAFKLLRGHYDGFNRSKYLPQLMRRCTQGGQAMVANTRLYHTPVGKPADVQVIQRYFQEDYWLHDLASGKPEAIWEYPYDRPHCYLLTNLEAYLDLYRATGDSKYLSAVDGAWRLFHENWENTGGSISIIENETCAPKSNKLYSKLGETCGSAFWLLLNQRLHGLRPDEERYVAEIEKSLYNILLASQDGDRSFRYHAMLVGKKEPGRAVNTCCEGQGTRILGSLPEYIYSISADGLYVNLYEPSSIEWSHRGAAVQATLRTDFPRSSGVQLEIGLPKATRMVVRLRIPSWVRGDVPIQVNDQLVTTAARGRYVVLDRLWKPGDRVAFELPMGMQLTQYAGEDQIAGRWRFALELGPFLMAALGAADTDLLLYGAATPDDILRRLRPDSGNLSHLTLPLIWSEIKFIPYWEVSQESFTCFPVIEARRDLV